MMSMWELLTLLKCSILTISPILKYHFHQINNINFTRDRRLGGKSGSVGVDTLFRQVVYGDTLVNDLPIEPAV